MKLTVYAVPVETLDSVWGSVEGYLSSGIEKAKPDYGIADIKKEIASGLWKLFAAICEEGFVRGACAVSFTIHPQGMTAFVASIGGRFIIDDNTVSQFKDLLSGFGATRLQGAVGEPLERFYKRFGFERKAILVEMGL